MNRLLLVLLLFLSPICYGSTGVGIVIEVIAYEKEDFVVIVLDGLFDGVPTCSDPGRYTYHVDASKIDSFFGFLEISIVGDMTVKITGTGACSKGRRSEDVELLEVGIACGITDQCKRR